MYTDNCHQGRKEHGVMLESQVGGVEVKAQEVMFGGNIDGMTGGKSGLVKPDWDHVARGEPSKVS